MQQALRGLGRTQRLPIGMAPGGAVLLRKAIGYATGRASRVSAKARADPASSNPCFTTEPSVLRITDHLLCGPRHFTANAALKTNRFQAPVQNVANKQTAPRRPHRGCELAAITRWRNADRGRPAWYCPGGMSHGQRHSIPSIGF
jgi:hypothetical protein